MLILDYALTLTVMQVASVCCPCEIYCKYLSGRQTVFSYLFMIAGFSSGLLWPAVNSFAFQVWMTHINYCLKHAAALATHT